MSASVADSGQRAAALDPEKSFIVQAPAGSGKTELLTRRILVLLAGVQAPEEVVAITFTRKAAGEMRRRILQALDCTARGEQAGTEYEQATLDLAAQALAQSRRLGWDLEFYPGRLRIQTIDSLCAGLAARMPLLSGLGGQGRISGEPEYMYTLAARRTLAELGPDSPWNSSVRALLRHLDNDHVRACGLIAGMLPQREQWLRHLADPQNRQLQRSRLEKALARTVEEPLGDVLGLMPGQKIQALLRLAWFAASNLPDGKKRNELTRLAQRQKPPRAASEDLSLWLALARFCLTGDGKIRRRADKNLGFPAPSSTKDPELKGLLQEKKEEFSACMCALSLIPDLDRRLAQVRILPAPGYTEEQWAIMEALFDVLRLAVGHLQLVFQEQGEVDYAEITSRAGWALGPAQEPTDLALILDQSIRHLLVDEFQDTSISQFMLLKALTAGWTPGDGRTFFAVGDPQQSIYGFREAEVGLFLQARQSGLGHVPLTPLRLSVNFRSSSGLVTWVNQAFPRVLPAAEDPLTGSVPYSPAQSFHMDDADRVVSIHPFFDPDYQAEAEKVVSLILRARESRPQGTIAVLVRNRSHLQGIIPGLRQSGLAFQAMDIDPLSQRPVIQDLSSLAKALVNPGHNPAWLSVLRAPWCGLELEDLDQITGEDPQCSVLSRLLDEDVLSGLSLQGQKRLGRVLPVLKAALDQRERTGLCRQVRACWEALGGPDCLQDSVSVQDAEKFFRLLRDRFEQAPQELANELDNAVSRLYAMPDTQADYGLQVMTIHKAKGLEFDTVILPGLGRVSPRDEHQLLVWLERPAPGGQSDLLLAPRTRTGEETDQVYAYIRTLMQQKSVHEDGRLLYVAATRARKELHILGHTGLDRENKPRSPAAGSLLASLWPAVEDAFVRGAENMGAPDGEAAEEKALPLAVRVPKTFYRLIPEWHPPEPAAGFKPLPGPDFEPGPEDIVFDWSGEMVRSVGTCVHGWLLVLAGEGLNNWDTDKPARVRPVFVRQLLELGLAEKDAEKGADLVQSALENTLKDGLGRWILGPHQEAENEYALSGLDQGRVVSVVMDRTFVDEEGVRWIIDYKTGRHEGTDVQSFLDREQLRYQERMRTYARLMQAMNPGPIRLGLYFPLLSGWREWEDPGIS